MSVAHSLAVRAGFPSVDWGRLKYGLTEPHNMASVKVEWGIVFVRDGVETYEQRDDEDHARRSKEAMEQIDDVDSVRLSVRTYNLVGEQLLD